MINELASWLLNVPGPEAFGPVVVPPEFKAVPLPTALESVRSVLFGRAPDRAMIKLRLGQLLPLAHAWIGANAPEGLDQRVSYDPDFLGGRLTPVFGVRMLGAGLTSALVRGEPPREGGSGVIEHAWSGTLAANGAWSVARTLPPGPSSSLVLEPEGGGGWLGPAVLPGSDLLVTPAVGAYGPVRVTAVTRPATDLPALAGQVEALGPVVRAALFSAPEASACETAWTYRHSTGPEKLAAVVVAYALAVARIGRGA